MLYAKNFGGAIHFRFAHFKNRALAQCKRWIQNVAPLSASATNDHYFHALADVLGR
jgi:hypothetical protein